MWSGKVSGKAAFRELKRKSTIVLNAYSDRPRLNPTLSSISCQPADETGCSNARSLAGSGFVQVRAKLSYAVETSLGLTLSFAFTFAAPEFT